MQISVTLSFPTPHSREFSSLTCQVRSLSHMHSEYLYLVSSSYQFESYTYSEMNLVRTNTVLSLQTLVIISDIY